MDKTKHSAIFRDAPGGRAMTEVVAGLTINATAPNAAVGVYVHFPWCLAKCPYCDFLSVATDRGAIPHRTYADAVLAELKRRLESYGSAPPRLGSVFFGGGTPSLWDPRELGRVLDAIRRAFQDSSESAEVTVECNPSSFDRRRAQALLEVGVNRISLGVQSLDEERLRFLGRLHTAAGGLSAVEAALEAGVPRVSADLIFGVAGQDAEAAAEEVRAVAGRGITHLSAYALTIEPGTAFGARARKGQLPLLDEAAVADSFIAVAETLGALGFAHYEVSNYARSGHVSEHNLGYWRGRDYLGLGCGAWGTVAMGAEHVRYRNTPVPERYVASTGAWSHADLLNASAGSLVQAIERLDGQTRLRERIMLGLRTAEGVDVERAAHDLGTEPWPVQRERAVRRWVDRGGLLRDGGRLSIPRDQWLLADGIIAEVM